MLTQIVDKQPVGIKIHLIYDIACSYLKVEMHVHIYKNMPMCIYHNTQVNSNEELLNRVEFAIPAVIMSLYGVTNICGHV